MFWKKKREHDRKLKLANAINDEVEKAIGDLRAFARAVNEGLCNCKYLEALIYELRWIMVRDLNYTDEELTERYNKVNKTRDELKNKLINYWSRVKANKADLKQWYEKGLPLFITMTSVENPEYGKIYAMCYEFKPDGDDKYRAYLFTNQRERGYVDTISAFEYRIDKMTEEEFENHYIIDRCSLCGLPFEDEGVEYDNSIRRLFNGQREN